MSIRSIRIYGDPVLRERARPVTEFDDALRELVADLYETMVAYNGVGLAAPQVGIPHRLLVIDLPLDDETRARFALINPELSERSGSEGGEEGCLSIPGVYDEVKRATRMRVKGLDEHGRPLDFEASGYLARAIQHEVDHLDGVLFIDRLSPLRRQFLRGKLEGLKRGEMPDGYPQHERGEGLG
ncbi:MAG: peptide deformylase [Candidatus Eisenbacteria bacterium]|uniref:Peptide deformylase n=1 Tax=Eiseniibacteriota bacterium TaxID=2212470 RepID=A0A849SA97_UNCEI|nr:peptide deformylase [Candidatus Eisenbacteria bacterium]